MGEGCEEIGQFHVVELVIIVLIVVVLFLVGKFRPGHK